LKLAIGTAQFGMDYGLANQAGQVCIEEAGQILQLGSEMGITTLDTAIGYGYSEKILGKLGVDNFNVVTKLPALPDGVSDVDRWIESEMLGSLNRLGVNTVYGVLLHRSSDLLGDRGKHIIRSLKSLKRNGMSQKTGISIYDPTELDYIPEGASIDIVQAPLNLVDRRLETSGWLKRLSEQGIEIHTRSTFLQGLLIIPRNAIPKEFERWSKLWDIWHNGLNKYQCTATAACLSYPLSLPEVDRVVVGLDTKRQLEELTSIAKMNVTPHDWTFMMSDEAQLINPQHWAHL
jgi:aryl-alcohol dehydrogenase-like predicted oxidoreductase